jgi:phospholipid/cholesterol/gamma-HCH transport system substrate-binding protein
MEPKVNYVIVGLFVVVLTTVLVIGIIWLSASQRTERDIFMVYMNEPVSGLSVQAPVKFNGVDVGNVADIQLNPDNPQQVQLLLSIDKGTPINQSTTATLMSQGITGITYVGLKAEAAKAPPIKILPGDEYPIIRSTPSLLVQISTVLSGLADTAKEIKGVLENTFNSENQKALHDSLQNISKITQTFSEHSQQITAAFDSAAQTLRQSQGAVQSLSQQTLPGINQMVNQINDVLRNMRQLSNTLKNNPSVLIRGQTPAPKGPGE